MMRPAQSLRTQHGQRRTIPVRRRFLLPSPQTARTDALSGTPDPIASSSAGRVPVFAAAALLCWAGVLAPASAQATGDTQSAQPCVAKPEDQANGGEGVDAAENRPQSSLQECGGVLAPPKTGDQMRVQPPDTGTTPVIPPGAIPEQSPK